MNVILSVCLMFLAAWLPLTGLAQTTEFTYQGQLTDSGTPQATYQMRFMLVDALVGGNQVGNTLVNNAVAVDNGIFSVSLDFGANPFPGANRFLEIAVRRNAGENYTVLSPRQQISSSPYAIRTLSAQTADLALDSEKLGGLDASEYVTNATVGSDFVRNDTEQQTANFNISGTGVIGTALGIGLISPSVSYDLDVAGAAQFSPGGSGGSIALGTPGAETGVSIVGTNRADMRFDGSTLKLLAGLGTGTPSSFNGLSISTIGNVGIGTTVPGARLAVSTHTTNAGNNTAYFEAPTIGPHASNVHYGATGDWYIRSASANGKVVLQDSGGNVGIGTSAPNAKLSLVGNATQDLNSRGFPKAMVFVLANAAISRCYNGITGSTTAGCGFTVSSPLFGFYTVNLGFDVSQSFLSLATYGDTSNINGRISGSSTNSVTVMTTFAYEEDGFIDNIPSDFFLIVY